jgi:hypothetical protein
VIEPTFGPGPLLGPSGGPRAARIARALFGLDLLDWERYCLDHMLERRSDGRLRYRVVVITVARQNGKSVILRVRLADSLIAGSSTACVMSHDRAQAREIIFEPLAEALGADRFEPLEVKIKTANGFERIVLGALDSRLVLLSPTEKGAHGYSLDLAVVDEAWSLFDYRVPQAITPTQVHRDDPQLVVVSTAGTEQSEWLRSLVDRGRAGGDGSLLYLEWSAPGELDPADPAAWRAANPSYEQGITLEALEAAYRSMPEQEFERAHLNRWTVAAETVISPSAWAGCHAPLELEGPLVFAFDVELDRSSSTIAAAGSTSSGRLGVEVIEQRPGTEWVLERLDELAERHGPVAIIGNAAGPSKSLVEQAAGAGVAVEPYNSTGYVAACQVLFDLVSSGRLAHRGQAPLDLAVAAAGRRPLGGSWVFGRAHPGAVISPLVAVTLAAHRASRPHLVPYIASV